LSAEITLKIDGKEVKAEKGTTILQVARANNIDIPTLCYDKKLTPYGGCRMCTVEISKGGRKRLVSSCAYPTEEDLEIVTNNERIRKVRGMLLELLLPRVDAEPFRQYAEKYGVTKSRFEVEPTDCVLCGLCVRYCAEIKKANAICFIGRGTNKEISPVPEVAPDICPKCQECNCLCPGGKILELTESSKLLSIPIHRKTRK